MTTAFESFPIGKYQTNLDNVRFDMILNSDGILILMRDGEFAVEAKYRVLNELFEITDVSGPTANANDGAGLYSWKKEGDQIFFEEIDDKAIGRKRALTQFPWTTVINGDE